MQRIRINHYTRAILLLIGVFLVSGCATLTKKFVREKKTSQEEEMVLVPQEYTGVFSKDIAYKQYYSYIVGWVEEAIAEVSSDNTIISSKRIHTSIQQAAENLKNILNLVKDEQVREQVIGFLSRLEVLKEDMKDANRVPQIRTRLRLKAERWLKDFRRELAYSKVEGCVQ